MSTEASIVLLTYNSEETIEDVLKGIFEQDTSIKYDVQVIDSGSKDGTINILKKFPVKIKMIEPESFNHGLTRNLGASLTSGEYILFLSHDAIPTKNWLEPLVVALEGNKKAAGAFSKQIPADKAPLVIKRALEEEWCFGSNEPFENLFPSDFQDHSKIYRTFFFTDVSSCIKRGVWEEIPFRRCETAEDILWASDVLKRGYTTIYQPESVVIHSHIRKIKRHFQDNFNHAKTMKKLILQEDIFGIRDNLSDKKTPTVKELEELSRPLNLPKAIYQLSSQIYKDLRYIITNEKADIPEKLRNMGYSILWQSASALGNYLGYRAKIE